MKPIDRIALGLSRLRRWAEEGMPLPFVDEGLDYVTGAPMSEGEICDIERTHEVSLPPEYREFLLRFGDGRVGPGVAFKRIREGLSPASSRPFPLSAPFLGSLAPCPDEYPILLEKWKRIPRDGTLFISDYGCAISAMLVLNGAFRGQIWMSTGDAAYCGPYGGFEPFDNPSYESTLELSENPRQYSFFEWYEHWLDVKLKMAGFVPW